MNRRRAKILTQTVETVFEIKLFLDPKLKLGENERLQFQTVRFAIGTTDFARASKAYRTFQILLLWQRRLAQFAIN